MINVDKAGKNQPLACAAKPSVKFKILRERSRGPQSSNYNKANGNKRHGVLVDNELKYFNNVIKAFLHKTKHLK